MKKRILSTISSIAILSSMLIMCTVSVQASNDEMKMVDGSYLTMEDESTGHSTSMARGQYLMTGDCSISNAGITRVYAYASTTANRTVNYIATLAYVEEYLPDVDAWGQVDYWIDEDHNDYYLSGAKSVTVERQKYYRVRANHIAGDAYPYEETATATDGIYVK